MLEASYSCPSNDVIEAVVSVVKSGGVAVIPTDTVYGLVADPFNPDAVERVYEVKERSRDNPVPLLAGESHHVLLVAEWDPRLWELAHAFWPGPLTVVLRPRGDAPEYLKAWGQVGVRLPNCPICREVARRVGGLIIGTSANISGRPSPVTAQEAMFQLGDRVDLYVDAGPAPLGRSSTVVDLRGPEARLIREGPIPWSLVLRALSQRRITPPGAP
ncbi:L-threonylcarbamoyladenylate synthase [Stetteria hydrogenophila]